MLMPDVIANKRDGKELSENELAFVVDGVCDGSIRAEQLGAWLMAVYNNSMSMEERITLTKLMRDSGEVVDWQGLTPLIVDKHSTGGVGDKVSLALAPALAACSLKVPMIAGRGLAHTGGTIDKLESIPGYTTSGNERDIRRTIGFAGCCIYSQSTNIAPADSILYAIRDVTATVPSIPLITASIISKKSAEGLSCLVLDIKVGSAAFMQSLEEARTLAKSMIEVGEGVGIEVRALLTRMENPIGTHIGNAHEVLEILDILEGTGSWDTISLIAMQGGHLLQMAGLVDTVEAGQMKILSTFSDGSAKHHWDLMCESQGVTKEVINQMRDYLETGENKFTLHSNMDGWVEDIDAMELAKVLSELGAGRSEIGQEIDHSVGAVIHAKVGAQVSEGDMILAVEHQNDELSEEIMTRLESCIAVSSSPISVPDRLIEVIE